MPGEYGAQQGALGFGAGAGNGVPAQPFNPNAMNGMGYPFQGGDFSSVPALIGQMADRVNPLVANPDIARLPVLGPAIGTARSMMSQGDPTAIGQARLMFGQGTPTTPAARLTMGAPTSAAPAAAAPDAPGAIPAQGSAMAMPRPRLAAAMMGGTGGGWRGMNGGRINGFNFGGSRMGYGG